MIGACFENEIPGICRRKVANRRRVSGAIRTLVNDRGLQFECARILHETFLVPVLMYDGETMIWKEKEKFMSLWRMDRVPNARIMEFCGVMKEFDERGDEGVLRWFDHLKRMESDRIVQIGSGVCR